MSSRKSRAPGGASAGARAARATAETEPETPAGAAPNRTRPRGADGARSNRGAAGARAGPGTPPPDGLDATRHAAAQRAAHGAEVLRQAIFPAIMATALPYDKHVDAKAYRVFLEQLLEDAGNPTDPIERMLLEQLALAHYRIGQLHISASHAKAADAAKIYNSAAARLLGEFRRTAMALRVYRGRVPEGDSREKLKVFKMAQ